MNFTRFPRRKYIAAPTPIEPMPNLSRALGKDLHLYIKRDDLLPGAAGGNKTRKLEFCMGEALAGGADTVITCGAIQSNHCRLTLAWAVKENLDCHLILEERVKGTYRPDAAGNNFLFQLMGVKSVEIVPGGTDMAAAMEQKAVSLRASGKIPYIIPGGASNAVGALGYAACAEEIMNQLNDMHLSVDHIIVPSGSAGTHAGMVAGLKGIHAGIPVTGMNVSRSRQAQEELVFRLARETSDKLGVRNGVQPEDVVCLDDYVGPGYSLPTEAMAEAVRMFARTEAVLLDPVYSGKAAAGLIDLVRRDAFPSGSTVLFLHTGGSPALYVYMDFLRRES